MQKIKLKNNDEITDIQSIYGYTETVGENDRRETLVIKVLNNTVDNLNTMLFADTTVLDSITILGQEEKVINQETQEKGLVWVTQGIHERYNLPCSITKDIINNVIEVKIARKSTLEQQLLETQLALAEIGAMLGGTL